MKTYRIVPAVLAALLFHAPMVVHADEWKHIADQNGATLDYQAVGNTARLRVRNTSHDPVTVRWNIGVLLSTGTTVENQGELNLAAGATEFVSGAPYRDNGHPAEVKSISGTVTTGKSSPQ